jgi:hypothetical protein
MRSYSYGFSVSALLTDVADPHPIYAVVCTRTDSYVLVNPFRAPHYPMTNEEVPLPEGCHLQWVPRWICPFATAVAKPRVGRH